MGEPAGIGPDIIAELAYQTYDAAIVVLADADVLRKRASAIGKPITIRDYHLGQHTPHAGDGTLTVCSQPVPSPVTPGQITLANEAYVLKLLDAAVEGVRTQQWDAFVTCPIHKAAVIEAGIAFSGHTEYLRDVCNTPTVMMLASDTLRVALVTTHLPLKDVPQHITNDNIQTTVRIVHHDLIKRFAIQRPRIAVCGLNPHAGEDGYLGDEEQTVITPAIQDLQQQGIDVRGPLPADTVFSAAVVDQFDVVVAMFHDQGLPVIKHADFGTTTNITLGLPFVRTSVDHGTALSLAASGKASPSSLFTAVRCAIKLCHQPTA